MLILTGLMLVLGWEATPHWIAPMIRWQITPTLPMTPPCEPQKVPVSQLSRPLMRWKFLERPTLRAWCLFEEQNNSYEIEVRNWVQGSDFDLQVYSNLDERAGACRDNLHLAFST